MLPRSVSGASAARADVEPTGPKIPFTPWSSSSLTDAATSPSAGSSTVTTSSDPPAPPRDVVGRQLERGLLRSGQIEEQTRLPDADSRAPDRRCRRGSGIGRRRLRRGNGLGRLGRRFGARSRLGRARSSRRRRRPSRPRPPSPSRPRQQRLDETSWLDGWHACRGLSCVTREVGDQFRLWMADQFDLSISRPPGPAMAHCRHLRK